MDYANNARGHKFIQSNKQDVNKSTCNQKLLGKILIKRNSGKERESRKKLKIYRNGRLINRSYKKKDQISKEWKEILASKQVGDKCNEWMLKWMTERYH